MNILVTGGTGFVGRPLVKRLVSAGHHVTVLSRDPRRAAKNLPARCRSVAWNPNKGMPAGVFDGVDVVIHLAGEGVADQRWSASRKRAILESRVLSTRALVDEMRAVAPTHRPKALISASAIGFYGDRDDEVLDETSAPGEGFLADVCGQWEREAQAANDLGVRLAMIRIGIVLGRGGGALGSMLPLFQLGAGGRVGSGTQWMSWIHLADLVRMLEWAATDERVTGVVNGVAPTPVQNSEFTSVLADVLKRPAFMPAPAIALKVALGEMSTLVLASQRVSPVAAKSGGFRFEFERLDDALRDLCADDAEVLEQEQFVPRPIDEVFPFFADAHNLEKLTPEFLNFEILNISTPQLAAGTLIDYRLRLHGIPLRWRTKIDEWEPGRRFVDVQLQGPYALWHHTHEFEPCDGGTLVRDRVRYRLPAGALGALVAGSFVQRDVNRIFDYRRERLEEIFGPHS